MAFNFNKLADSRKVAVTFDPAIDKESPSYDEAAYLKTLDLRHLPAKEGEKLALFEIRPLSREQILHVLDKSMSGPQQAVEAVAFALVGIENCGEVKLERHDKPLGRRLTKQALDAIYDPFVFGQLSERILEISTLHPTSG